MWNPFARVNSYPTHGELDRAHLARRQVLRQNLLPFLQMPLLKERLKDDDEFQKIVRAVLIDCEVDEELPTEQFGVTYELILAYARNEIPEFPVAARIHVLDFLIIALEASLREELEGKAPYRVRKLVVNENNPIRGKY